MAQNENQNKSAGELCQRGAPTGETMIRKWPVNLLPPPVVVVGLFLVVVVVAHSQRPLRSQTECATDLNTRWRFVSLIAWSSSWLVVAFSSSESPRELKLVNFSRAINRPTTTTGALVHIFAISRPRPL